jgi:hypothetical protein
VAFWAWDYQLEDYYRVPASLKHASPICAVYVEDGAQVTGGAIRELAELFEDIVYPQLRELYGSEPLPGIDGRSPVTLLLLDIRDPLYHGQTPSTYISGFFDPSNEFLQSELDRERPGLKSNQREMLYLDVSPTDPRGEIIRQTLAHEFAHLIQWNYDPDEDGWLVEALGELAVHLSGLGHPRAHVEAYLADPEVSLTSWDGEVRDYGKVYVFMLYVYEQVGRDRTWLKDLVASPNHGMAALESQLPESRHLRNLLIDFGVALHLDLAEPGEGRYGFRALALDGSEGVNGFAPAARNSWPRFPIDNETVEVTPWTVRGDLFEPGRGIVEVEVTTSSGACVGAGWRVPGEPVPSRWSVEVRCPDPAEPALWQIESHSTNTYPAEVHIIAANASDDTMSLTMSAIPPVGVESPPPTAYFPLVMRR